MAVVDRSVGGHAYDAPFRVVVKGDSAMTPVDIAIHRERAKSGVEKKGERTIRSFRQQYDALWGMLRVLSSGQKSKGGGE